MGIEQTGQQLLGRLTRIQLDQLVLLAGQQQAGLELQQGGDQHQELGGRLQVQLASPLQMVDVGDDDLGQVDLEQIDLLAQDQRQQKVKRPSEDVEIELQIYQTH